MSAAFRFNPCACGCGQIAQGRFVRGHNNLPIIRPAGMSAERAEEIALAVWDAGSPSLRYHWGHSRYGLQEPAGDAVYVPTGMSSHRVNAGRPVGARWTPEQAAKVEVLLDAGLTPIQVALDVGVSSRSVQRRRAVKKLMEGNQK